MRSRFASKLTGAIVAVRRDDQASMLACFTADCDSTSRNAPGGGLRAVATVSTMRS